MRRKTPEAVWIIQGWQRNPFSRKLKEVAQVNAKGKNVISLGIGSPDMPPSEETVNVLCEQAKRPDAHGYQPTCLLYTSRCV